MTQMSSVQVTVPCELETNVHSTLVGQNRLETSTRCFYTEFLCHISNTVHQGLCILLKNVSFCHDVVLSLTQVISHVLRDEGVFCNLMINLSLRVPPSLGCDHHPSSETGRLQGPRGMSGRQALVKCFSLEGNPLLQNILGIFHHGNFIPPLGRSRRILFLGSSP